MMNVLNSRILRCVSLSVLAAMSATVSYTTFAAGEETDAVPSLERQRELVRMVRQDCGSCHGMTLNGGLGPALTPEALKLRGIEKVSMVATIIGGRPGTPMPPWGHFMSEAEAGWIVEQLLDGFPER